MHPPPRVNVAPREGSYARLPDQVPQNHALSGARSAYDHILLRVRVASAGARSFYRDGYALTEPHLSYFRVLYRGVDDYLGALLCVVIRPREVWIWCRKNVISREGVLRILARTGRDVSLDAGHCIGYAALVALKFVTLPWYSPEDRSRLAYLRMVSGKGKQRTPGPTPDGYVRVKWYPDVEAPLKWPAGLGDLWADLPTEPDSSLDLRPLKRMWGMENCYVMLAGPGKRIQIGRRPDETLSALAWTVSLGKGSVLGVIEQPEPRTVAARKGRALLKRALDPKETPYLLYELSSPLLWIVVTLLAVAAFTFWLLLGALIGIARVGIRWVVRSLSAAVYAATLRVRRVYDALWLSIGRAWDWVGAIPGMIWATGWGLLVFLGRGVVMWIIALAEACLLTDEEVAELAHAQAQGQAHPHPQMQVFAPEQVPAHAQMPVQMPVPNQEVDASDAETLLENEEDDDSDETVVGDEW
ncbi:hypothetical protein TRAPUB_10172 [Trametes pubescens]|uniref:Uncharacterized protein n=1 Tax=Trametes pubescens TaxID=154538 RepID=A0A1M2W084_TRAPU|nr:hypothetical protein TRAPUB_10172 [Trametes pubescens]